jgi:ribosomal protein L37AE/L43A
MNLFTTRKRVMTSPAPNAPLCPRCHTQMAPRARTAPVARFKPPIGATVNRRLELAVWFCENCGIKRPRFG